MPEELKTFITSEFKKIHDRIEPIEKFSKTASANPGFLYSSDPSRLSPGRDSAGYSILKAVKFCTGRASKLQAKEELHIHEQLRDLYEELGYTREHGDLGFMMPFATEHIPDAGIKRGGNAVDGGKLRQEIRQKMAATIHGFDPYEAASYARKVAPSWNMQKAMGTVPDT